jgi:hypothetical protein
LLLEIKHVQALLFTLNNSQTKNWP